MKAFPTLPTALPPAWLVKGEPQPKKTKNAARAMDHVIDSLN